MYAHSWSDPVHARLGPMADDSICADCTGAALPGLRPLATDSQTEALRRKRREKRDGQRARSISTRQSADPGSAARRSDDLRRQGSGNRLSADRPMRPPTGAPNVLIVLIDDVGFGASSAFGGPIHTPTAERLGAERAEVQSLPHDGALLADAAGAADRAQSPFGEHGRHLRDRDLGSRLQLGPAEETRRRSPMTLKLNGYSTAQFGKCHEVPVWETSPMGPFDQWPTGGGGFEYFYGFIGGETNQWYPGHLRRHDAGRAGQDPGGGLPLHRGHDRQGDRLGAPAEGADARQAVLHVFRARRDPRAAPRAEGVDRQVQGQVRPGLGQAARRDLRPPEGARRHPAGCRADAAAGGDPGLRRHAGGAQADSRAARWRSTPASSSTPTTTSAGWSTRSRTSSVLDDTLDLLHHRRQRRLGRRHARTAASTRWRR